MTPSPSPAAATAFFCCAARAADARRRQPVCGDRYAARLLGPTGRRAAAAFRWQVGPNAFVVARHRLIDDVLRVRLSADPSVRVVTVGAGLDSRPYRLRGGHWVEVDERQLLAGKEAQLPAAGCPNPLARVAADAGELDAALAPYAGPGPTVVVIEGVLMYLPADVADRLFGSLRRLFPRHALVCDLMTRAFADTYGRGMRARLAGLGVELAAAADDPAGAMAAREYRAVGRSAVADRAAFWGVRVPPAVLRRFAPGLTDGYAVHVFEAGEGPIARPGGQGSERPSRPTGDAPAGLS